MLQFDACSSSKPALNFNLPGGGLCRLMIMIMISAIAAWKARMCGTRLRAWAGYAGRLSGWFLRLCARGSRRPQGRGGGYFRGWQGGGIRLRHAPGNPGRPAGAVRARAGCRNPSQGEGCPSRETACLDACLRGASLLGAVNQQGTVRATDPGAAAGLERRITG